MAGWTGLEPAASGVTGRRYNQLNYHPHFILFIIKNIVLLLYPSSCLFINTNEAKKHQNYTESQYNK